VELPESTSESGGKWNLSRKIGVVGARQLEAQNRENRKCHKFVTVITVEKETSEEV